MLRPTGKDLGTVNQINREQIPTPIVSFTDIAWQQLNLILENDFTLNGKYLRLLISGKGCDGFTYSIGFTDPNEDDFFIPVNDRESSLEILMDPFTAFYLQDSCVDFIQNFDQDAEGFTVKNNRQDDFKGKFWKKDSDKTPPLKI